MGRFVAIGGGDYEAIDPIVSRIVSLSRKEIPNVLFIGTALQDSTNPLTSCKKSFKRVAPGCIVKKLSVIRSSYTEEQMDELFSWADVIFCGGGNTAYMLEKWQEFGIDKRLKQVFREDSAVLSGVSAGAICWFSKGYTDSESFTGSEDWQFRIIEPGFDFYPAFFCPHYNDWKRSGFDEILLKELEGIPGIALEDCTAFIYDNGEISYTRSSDDAHVYGFTKEQGKVMLL